MPARDGLIDGREPASQDELRTAIGLDRLRHTYVYQYQVYDIRGARGTFFVDFFVTSTPPLPTPLEVNGEFWHQGEMSDEELFRIAQIEDYFRGRANPLKILWGSETLTQDSTDAALRLKVGPG